MRQGLLCGLLIIITVLCAVRVGGATDKLSFAGAPRSDDGRFTNLAGDIGHGNFAVRFPFMLRRLGTYFRSGDGAPERVANDGSFLRENARHSIPTVTWVGHATLLVQMEHVSFLTDPIWSNRPSPVPLLGPRRFVEPGLLMDELPPIGAYEPRAMMRESHMNPEEALRAAIDLRAYRAMAMHFGTFDLSDEPLAEPPLRYRDAARNSELGGDAAWVLDIGETRTF